VADTIRIFVGCSGNNEDLEFQSVLHYSLEKHASQPLDITWLRLSRDPDSFWYSNPQNKEGWRTEGWATPFSALRWGIPAACNYEGRAIYMDLDKIALADIAELWNQPMPNGAAMLSKPEAMCVTMFDCRRMKAVLPPIDEIRSVPGGYRKVRDKLSKMNGIVARYRGDWNCLDMRRVPGGGEYKDITDPEIKILHFTEIPTQPHFRYALPRLTKEGGKHWYTAPYSIRPHPRKDAVKLFDALLLEADACGYEIDRYRNPVPFGDYGRFQ
jgi:hypothetical protein